MTFGQEGEPLSILAVQMTSSVSSEVFVLHTLLREFAQAKLTLGVAGRVLLVQGVDGAGGRRGREAADLFRGLPGVSLQEVEVGRLGQPAAGLRVRAMKFHDAARLEATVPDLVRVARDFRPSLVYSAQQIWDLRVATPIAAALRIPQVVHLHYHCGDWLGRGTMDILRRARMVIGVSEFIRQDAIDHGIAPERARALYNSIPVPPLLSAAERRAIKAGLCAELGIPDGSLLIGMTARLAAWKGQEALAEAIAPLLAAEPRAHLLLAGSEYPGPNGVGDRVREIARSEGVLARVHLLGNRNDVPRILNSLDLFAHPSRLEPCSIAVLEAGAHGLPVVAWSEGGTADLVAHGETGLLAEPMDIAGLRAALSTLIADHELRMLLGHRARQRAEALFRPDRQAAAFLGLLRDAASAGVRPAPAARHGADFASARPIS